MTIHDQSLSFQVFLRPKKTWAIRKAMTAHEASLKTVKETRRLKAFPQRKS